MRSREILYEKRRKRVNDVCLKYGQDLHRRDDHIAGSFMVSEENLIAYCRMGKVSRPFENFKNHSITSKKLYS
jgi:hypothetical protein